MPEDKEATDPGARLEQERELYSGYWQRTASLIGELVKTVDPEVKLTHLNEVQTLRSEVLVRFGKLTNLATELEAEKALYEEAMNFASSYQFMRGLLQAAQDHLQVLQLNAYRKS